uniref:Uncharacterized protein n=1 Tax=Lygus hesperus TaxID=30085 RepID=A0A146LWG1_LYGHE
MASYTFQNTTYGGVGPLNIYNCGFQAIVIFSILPTLLCCLQWFILVVPVNRGGYFVLSILNRMHVEVGEGVVGDNVTVSLSILVQRCVLHILYGSGVLMVDQCVQQIDNTIPLYNLCLQDRSQTYIRYI